jgi:hypothetical protein
VLCSSAGSKGTLRIWDSSSGNFVHSTVVVPNAEGDEQAGGDSAANTLTGLQLLPASLGRGLMISTGEAKLLVYSPETQEGLCSWLNGRPALLCAGLASFDSEASLDSQSRMAR